MGRHTGIEKKVTGVAEVVEPGGLKLSTGVVTEEGAIRYDSVTKKVKLHDGVAEVDVGGVYPAFPSSGEVTAAAGTQPLLEYFFDGDYANAGSLGASGDMTPLAPNPGVFTGSPRSEKKLAACAHVFAHTFAGGRTGDLAALNINGACTLFLCLQGISASTQWNNSNTFTLAWIGRTGAPNDTLFGVYVYGATSTLIFYTYHGGALLLTTDILLQPGQPYNLAVTRSAASGGSQQIRVYLNGREVLDQTVAEQTTTAGNNFFDVGNAHSTNTIGQAVYDYAALWNVELTPTQVEELNALFPIR